MEITPPKRRFWQHAPVRWSVRTLMALVLVAAVGLGWLANRARVQRDATAAIEKAGGKAFYDFQLKTVIGPDWQDLTPNTTGVSKWPKWLIDRIGLDYFQTVKLVIIPGAADPLMPEVARLDQLEEIDFFPRRNDSNYGPTDAGMDYLKGLKQLRHLKLSVNTANGVIGSQITGKGLAAIAGATKLQILEMKGVPISDPDLAILEGMTDLRLLEIGSPNITDAGLVHLAGLHQIRRLSLEPTRVTSAGIKHLRGMPRLHNLNLSLSQVESLEPFRRLPSLATLSLAKNPINDESMIPADDPGFARLVTLHLFQTQISDESLKYVRDFPKLKRLVVAGTKVTDAGVAEFKKDQPKVQVVLQTGPPTPRPRPPIKK